MTRPSSKVRKRAALALAAAVATTGLAGGPAGAAIETDPGALYQTMRKAYDEGNTKGWPFQSELYYQSTVLDAGRAYSLFRATDPQYGDVAALTVDVATQLHYDPLTNDDAALWYVLEAANYEAKTATPPTRPKGRNCRRACSRSRTTPRSSPGKPRPMRSPTRARFTRTATRSCNWSSPTSAPTT